MEIVTGSTGVAHVTPIDDAVRNVNPAFLNDRVVFTVFENLAARAITANEVRVSSGYGMNQGRIFKINENAYDTVTIENGTQGQKRADLIVARYTMNVSTGFESIDLAVIKGTAGTEYADPTYTSGNINSGATADDFPLYRVKLNGIVIEDVEQLFTLLPVGGRIGELADRLDGQIAVDLSTEQRGVLDGSENVNVGAIGVLPVSHGGTGATTAAQALENLGVPAEVANAATKSYVDNKFSGIPNGNVIVSNGTGSPTSRAINSSSGGVQNSTSLTTAGALYATKAALESNFRAGVDTIYNAIVRNGVTPSSSTPNACATGIDNVYQKGKTDAEAVTWTEMLNPTFVGKNSGTVSTKIENYLELRVSLANVVNFKITGMSNISIENSGHPEVDITYYNGSTEIGTAAIYELNKNFTPPNNATEMKLQAWSNVGQVGIGGQVTSSYVMMLTKRAKKLR